MYDHKSQVHDRRTIIYRSSELTTRNFEKIYMKLEYFKFDIKKR